MQSSAVIVTSLRTPVGKAKRGALRFMRPEEMGAEAVRAALDHTPNLSAEEIDDVLIGCAFPEGSQGMNVGRIIAGRAGLPDSVPGATVNRFCSSGLQTIAMANQAIGLGQAECIIAGGAESMTLVPMSGYYFQPDPETAEHRPEVYVSMGNTAENLAQKYNISREDQDLFALRSHERALAAQSASLFEEELIPLDIKQNSLQNGTPTMVSYQFNADEGPRADTSLEALSRLRPVFRSGGSVTAGNSSQMSDGAAATVVMSEAMAQRLGAEPLARMVGFAVAGVAPDLMGIGPVPAIKNVLKQTDLSLDQIGLIELNEAFAAQALAVIMEAGLDESIVNVQGGAIALGHPLGCTGAKLTATLLHAMKRDGIRYGLCTMCIGGGMGAAAIFENLT